jgi:hypothetical protein
MSKFTLLPTYINSAALVTTLALATIFYPARTLSQTPINEGDATPQTGCLSGYSDGTYRGSRPVTRYEFAAGLNACLNQVDKLLPPHRENLATKKDFEVLIQRQRELNEQLRGLNQQVDRISPAKK